MRYVYRGNPSKTFHWTNKLFLNSSESLWYPHLRQICQLLCFNTRRNESYLTEYIEPAHFGHFNGISKQSVPLVIKSVIVFDLRVTKVAYKNILYLLATIHLNVIITIPFIATLAPTLNAKCIPA